MEADAYADSGFLVSLYLADAGHEAATRYLVAEEKTLALTPLHRVEVRNALRNARAAGRITLPELRRALRQIDDDLKRGLLVPVAADWGGMCRRADELGDRHGTREEVPMDDLLHVALAIECGAKPRNTPFKTQAGERV